MKHEKGEFPYKNKRCFVFTRTSMEDTDNVKFVNGDIVNFVNQLKKEEGKNIWIVGGGELLFSFIKEKLIDELIVTVTPIVIGKGIPLFREGDYQIELTLKGTRNFNQFVELHYEVKDK